jgi:L-lactate permease
MIMDGWRGVQGDLACHPGGGVSFAVTQFLTANYIGPRTARHHLRAGQPDFCLTAFLKNWKPKRIFRFDRPGSHQPKGRAPFSFGAILKAWSPFVPS